MVNETLRIAIDPGKEALAWVLGKGRIAASGIIEECDPRDVSKVISVFNTGLLTSGFGLDGFLGSRVPHIEVWIEYMQSRGGETHARTLSKAKALLSLQFIGAALAGAIVGRLGGSVHPVTYHQWSGGATEAQVKNRLYSPGILSPEEAIALDPKRYRAGIRHNLYDAASLFLYATGRVRPGQILGGYSA